MNIIQEGCGIFLGIGQEIKGTILEIKFLFSVINANSGTVERIINSRNNHGYKYLYCGEMMKKLKYNRMGINDIMSFNQALRKCYIRETNDFYQNPDTKKITTSPEEIAQRAYSDTNKSQGDVDPEFKKQFDTAFQQQLDQFDKLSPESQKEAILMYGDPRLPEYRTQQFEIQLGKFRNPAKLGSTNLTSMGVKLSKDEMETEQGAVLPHEMTHVQQLTTKNASPEASKNFMSDLKLPYREQKIEAGAESKANILTARNVKSPEDSLKPLSTTEVDDALKATKSGDASYTGFESLPSKTQTELKNYLRHMIVKGNQQQGTVA